MVDYERVFPKREGKYVSSVKVGPKGQIVIPKEARDMMNIQPGDTLLLLADIDRGIALDKMSRYRDMIDRAFSGAPMTDQKET